MSDRYDVIIIGAGLSGLAAGIRLAYYEKKVCVLERHYTIGGLNSFYRLRKKNHDVGLHAVTNWRPPGTKTGPLSKLLRQLRLKWEDFDLVPQNSSRIDFPSAKLSFTNDFTVLESEIAEKFPSQIDGFRRLTQFVNESDPFDESPEETSTRAVLKQYLSDPLLIDMLLCPVMFYGSATPHDLDYRQFVILFRALYQEGFGRPYAGVRPIMKAIVKQFRGLGGELLLRHGVKAINSHNGKTTGVTLDDGRVLEGDVVMSSAGAAETARLCGDSSEQKPEYRPGELSFLESISILNREPSAIDHNDAIVFFSLDDQFAYRQPAEPVDPRSGVICSPNNYQYDEPLEDGRIRLTCLANPEYWINADDETYYPAKEKALAEMTAAAASVIPDFRPYTVDTDIFSPRTVKKYTGHINGAVYGSPVKFRDGTTHVENLYLCGTDQGYLGIIGAMLSGVTVVNKHLLR
ncbi:phytoene desaturase family protein [Calycomorphotria hydatis]|uniref:Diapolycopene oxygenase n=1 Tax=Calycomorphotria hydatis TaxID=2528027 RepID=A0A517T8T3_9PLAN|nr:NAD(P)/FAD-dependent oxidoreductase [Calycomorphotria hydatis]QDT64785.1 Diapolycopene oxygenase [Calycomorphotria hydatis]